MRKAKVLTNGVVGHEVGDLVEVYSVEEAIASEPFSEEYFTKNLCEGFVFGKDELYVVFPNEVEFIEED